jgi:SAM-dependent methyltransferase
MIDRISEELGRYYSEKFAAHGANSQGVDWGTDQSKMFLRYEKMLSVVSPPNSERPSLLDVGCGYGGLLGYATDKGIGFDYTGIDVAANMIEWAANNMQGGRFINGDVMTHQFETDFDYVVCNGILTQKLDTPGREMDRFAGQLIRRLFEIARHGLAFNVMTTKVNHFSNNLYYRNPAELLAWCMTEISPSIKLDHSYPLYEYTVYLMKDGNAE